MKSSKVLRVVKISTECDGNASSLKLHECINVLLNQDHVLYCDGDDVFF